MSEPGSVTRHIAQLKAGDHTAAQELWERYFRRLVGLARKKLRGSKPGLADEEDVALSAFDSFCRGAERGRFPLLGDRHDLWSLLVRITASKAADLRRDEARLKRGGGRVLGESALGRGPEERRPAAGLDGLLGEEPTPAFAAQVAEQCRRLLDLLGDAELRSVALWKMEGFTAEEIAARLGCVPRTVERKLQRIRSRWAREVQP